MTKLNTDTVQIKGNEFKIKYFSEYDFPENYHPEIPFSWDGLMEVHFSPINKISASEAEKIVEDFKSELYKQALKITQENPIVYDKFELKDEYRGKVTYSVGSYAVRIKVVFRLDFKE